MKHLVPTREMLVDGESRKFKLFHHTVTVPASATSVHDIFTVVDIPQETLDALTLTDEQKATFERPAPRQVRISLVRPPESESPWTTDWREIEAWLDSNSAQSTASTSTFVEFRHNFSLCQMANFLALYLKCQTHIYGLCTQDRLSTTACRFVQISPDSVWSAMPRITTPNNAVAEQRATVPTDEQALQALTAAFHQGLGANIGLSVNTGTIQFRMLQGNAAKATVMAFARRMANLVDWAQRYTSVVKLKSDTRLARSTFEAITLGGVIGVDVPAPRPPAQVVQPVVEP